MADESLYEQPGGVFAIAAVVDHFSDAIVQNPIVGKVVAEPGREWHTMCSVAGGPFQYTATKPGMTEVGLEEAHRELKIAPEEFDEVAAELARTLDVFKVPQREKDEVLGAFAAHKNEVTAGYVAAVT
jgi:hemoglobin